MDDEKALRGRLAAARREQDHLAGLHYEAMDYGQSDELAKLEAQAAGRTKEIEARLQASEGRETKGPSDYQRMLSESARPENYARSRSPTKDRGLER